MYNTHIYASVHVNDTLNMNTAVYGTRYRVTFFSRNNLIFNQAVTQEARIIGQYLLRAIMSPNTWRRCINFHLFHNIDIQVVDDNDDIQGSDDVFTMHRSDAPPRYTIQRISI